MVIDPNQLADRAEELFREGYACSQAVLMACATHLDLPPLVAARAASAFGGGMARHGWTCGAVTGAMMAIGYHAGNETAGEKDQKDDSYARIARMVDAFRAEHGATECSRLLGLSISDPVQRQAASDAGLFKTVCPRFVHSAAALAARELEAPKLP
jgi:C_GCAxxG_C_C family probable redox protein